MALGHRTTPLGPPNYKKHGFSLFTDRQLCHAICLILHAFSFSMIFDKAGEGETKGD